MGNGQRECRAIRRDLAQNGKLNAVRRGQVDVHLRRCPSCAYAADGLALLESEKPEMPEITADKSAKIYDRLLPAVHEIALDFQQAPTEKAVFWPAFAAGIGFVAVAVLAIFMFVGNSPSTDREVASIEGASDLSFKSPKPKLAVWDDSESNDGYVDRMEGLVLIDNAKDTGNDGSFTVKKGTTVEVGKSSRFNFRIGNLARIALLEESKWRVKEISDSLISIELNSGKLAVAFDGSYGKRLEVITPDSIVRVKGTTFTVEVFDDDSTRVSVLEGRVEVASLKSSENVYEVGDGELVQIPGEGRVVALGDEQRALAGEVEEALEDSLVATFGRLVRFDGSPTRVKVEVENRFLGYTPLTVRLPEGPVFYKLSAPGMEPYEAKLEKEQVGEDVAFSMEPSADYQPVVAKGAAAVRGKKRSNTLISRKPADKANWNLVVRARAAMKAGDIPFAARLLEQSSHGVDEDQLVTVLSLLAECYSAIGYYKKAADTFDRVAGIVPGSKIAQNSRYAVGRLSMDHIGDYGRARTAFTAYVASPLGGQLKETAYFSLCELYGREGVQRSALQCFNDFLRAFPTGYRQPTALLWRGVLYQEVEQRWGDAERDLMAFIRAKPRHPRCEEARYRIALGRYHVGDKHGAIRMLQEYIREHASGQYRVRVDRLKRAILDPHFPLSPDSK